MATRGIATRRKLTGPGLLPEDVGRDCLAKLLDLFSLLDCRSVSRAWNKMFMSRVRILPVVRHEADCREAALGHVVALELEFEQSGRFVGLVHLFPNLERVSMADTLGSEIDWSVCPNLRHMKVSRAPVREKSLCVLLRQVRVLQRLELLDCQFKPEAVTESLCICPGCVCPMLTKVHVTNNPVLSAWLMQRVSPEIHVT